MLVIGRFPSPSEVFCDGIVSMETASHQDRKKRRRNQRADTEDERIFSRSGYGYDPPAERDR